MFTIKVGGTGSSGNGYLLKTSKDSLLLEAGIPKADMLNMVDWDVSGISGCLITHKHSDHAKHIKEYLLYGFSLYASENVNPDLKCRAEPLRRLKKANIGKFTVIPFAVPHDDTECDGFVIEHEEIGRLLYMTDLEYCPYDFSKLGVDHVLIEANYSTKYVDMAAPNTAHIFKGHMEIETCKRFISSLNGEKLRSVGLIHLSNNNSDRDSFKAEIESIITGDTYVWVAKKGDEVIFR